MLQPFITSTTERHRSAFWRVKEAVASRALMSRFILRVIPDGRIARCLTISFLAVLCACAAMADTIYSVSVDTSSIENTAGSLDFNFNPGLLVTQSASLQILNFASDGTLAGGCPCGTGDVSGTLPGTLTFDNGTSFNDYFEGFTFGSTLSFDVRLYGPAVNSPDGVSTSGSTFAFSMFSNSAGTTPTLTTDTTNGFAFTTDVNLDGTTTVSDFSAQTSVAPETSSVPEPNEIGPLVFLSLMAWIGAKRGRRFLLPTPAGSGSLSTQLGIQMRRRSA